MIKDTNSSNLTVSGSKAIDALADGYPELQGTLAIMLDDSSFIQMVNDKSQELSFISLISEIHNLAFEQGFKTQMSHNQNLIDDRLSATAINQSASAGRNKANERATEVVTMFRDRIKSQIQQ